MIIHSRHSVRGDAQRGVGGGIQATGKPRRRQMMRRFPMKRAASLVLLLALVVPTTSATAADFRPAVRGPLGVVATTSPFASRAALDVLRDGGNAVDAAVTAVFTVGVVRPEMCGIGGGGFLVYRGADGKVASLDFREISPAKDYQFRNEMRVPGSDLATRNTGHGVVGVPGTVKGMSAALAEYGSGSITLARTLEPAITHATNGFPVTPTTSWAMHWRQIDLTLFPESSRTYLKPVPAEQPGRGLTRAYAPGEKLVLPDYAETLKRIAAKGEAEFYDTKDITNITARLLAEEMSRPSPYAETGDVSEMRAEDLSNYQAKWRTPVVTKYRGHEVIGMPAPSSGGTAVAEMLNILEGYDLAGSGRSSPDHLHLLLEAQKIAWADRSAYLGDPDKVVIPPQLTTKSYAEQRRADISLTSAGDPVAGGPFPGSPQPWDDEGRNTTHVSVIDAHGNAVAVTCSIEQAMGSSVVPVGLGFLLNGQLSDFTCSRINSTDPCDTTSPNAPEARKRPRSSMSPTIVVRQGQPLLTVGGAGGATIIMGVLQAVVNTVDFGLDPAEAIDAPRVNVSGRRVVTAENGERTVVFNVTMERRLEAAFEELTRRGHSELSVSEGNYSWPVLEAAGIDLKTNERLAASDPREGLQADGSGSTVECGAAAHEKDGYSVIFQCPQN